MNLLDMRSSVLRTGRGGLIFAVRSAPPRCIWRTQACACPERAPQRIPVQRPWCSGTSLSNGAPLTEGLLALAPLQTRQLQKEVSEDVLDAMRRTLSGMLGLLPSDNWTVRSTVLFLEPTL